VSIAAIIKKEDPIISKKARRILLLMLFSGLAFAASEIVAHPPLGIDIFRLGGVLLYFFT
jgi:hypothetical protein